MLLKPHNANLNRYLSARYEACTTVCTFQGKAFKQCRCKTWWILNTTSGHTDRGTACGRPASTQTRLQKPFLKMQRQSYGHASLCIAARFWARQPGVHLEQPVLKLWEWASHQVIFCYLIGLISERNKELNAFGLGSIGLVCQARSKMSVYIFSGPYSTSQAVFSIYHKPFGLQRSHWHENVRREESEKGCSVLLGSLSLLSHMFCHDLKYVCTLITTLLQQRFSKFDWRLALSWNLDTAS